MDAHDTTAEPVVTASGCGGTSAARVHDPASREEEAERVAGDGGEQHAAVERHDGQHDEVRRAHPGRVRRREQRGRGRRDAASRPRAAARDAARGGGERLGERGERQHEEETEQVRARAARAGPPREQHHRAVAPGEGRVLRHRHVRGRSRLARRRRRRCLRRAHALHCCWIFGTGRGRVLGYSERAKRAEL